VPFYDCHWIALLNEQEEIATVLREHMESRLFSHRKSLHSLQRIETLSASLSVTCMGTNFTIPYSLTPIPCLYHRGATSPESASAYASTAITAAFSFKCFGSTLSNVSAGVW